MDKSPSSQPRVSIAFVNSLPRWGGGEKWFVDAAAAMRARGHRVCVLGQPSSEIVRRAQELGLTTFGVQMHGIFDPRTLVTMHRLLRRERVEVAFVNQAREIRLVGVSQLGRQRFRLVARRGSPDPIKDIWHFRWVYTHLVDRLLVNAQSLIGRVCDSAPWFDRQKIVVLPNGIEVETHRAQASAARGRASLGLAMDAPVVAMVGEVGWRKDQATFLRAVAQLRRERPDAPTRFLIVGEGEDRPRLQAEGRALGLHDDHVQWLGFRRDVADLIAASDLVVLPSREEGFPNTLLEAMALGRCVVATPVDGIPELVEDGRTGVLVPVADPLALASAIGKLLDDPRRRMALGMRGEQHVRAHFDQARIMDQLEALVLQLTR